MAYQKREIQIYEHHVKYYETDQMAIVHHSNYIRWMEEARMDFMEQMGFSYKQMEEVGIISPVLAVACEYRNMVHFQDTVQIRTTVAAYNGIKLKIGYEMYNKETGELTTIGTSSHCFLVDGKPVSLKRSYPDIDEIFLAYLEPHRLETK